MNIGNSMERLIREEARLIILRTLAGQPDFRLHSDLLRLSLEGFGIRRTREWVHAEIRYLEQIGAVTVTEAGSVLVAALTSRGEDHVAQRAVLDAVKRPSPPSV
ncbi:hypothetical protein [Blastochloris tepida]|uniref:Uncharacterized protein n=1 Tax=Blastochloris tepida TaxID=2233851 RepID=A0A348FYI9_9HYPH|nr:hypothetical protein [Blastochloris tepida]BBF92372.1 hypothetical protein BLTE_10570 [Blastochloris tepida]